MQARSLPLGEEIYVREYYESRLVKGSKGQPTTVQYYAQTTPGTLVLLVRHGATGLNNAANPKVRGWEDIELSPEGQRSIKALAKELKPYKPQYIYSSDFMRDSQTGEILASALGIVGREVEFDARTWDVGTYSGKPESEVNPAIEELYRRPWEKPPGSSESFDTFSKRWIDFLDRKLQFATIDGMRPTIIVTHGRNIALTDSYLNFKQNLDGLMPLAGGYAVVSVAPDRSLQFQIQGESECVCRDV